MQKVERLVAITLLLQARGKMTAERLADIMDVSVRTIYRDMDALSLAHVPVAMDYGPGGGYYLPDDYRLDPATFTSEEAVALALGGAVAGSYALFEQGDGLQRALVKLEAALPEEYRSDVRSARERILFDATSWYHRGPAMSEHLETVREAVWRSHRLEMLYPRSEGEGSDRRTVEPYGLVCKAGVWYLAAFCLTRQDFRTFRVDRIEEARVLEEECMPRPEFDLQRYWEEARRRFEEQVQPFKLLLRVGPSALRRLAGDGRVLDEEEDGHLLVRVSLESEHIAIQYALWLGADATVIDPPRVRERVAEEARAIAALYA